MPQTIKEKLAAGPLFDSAIIEHHFTSYMRDYDLIIDVAAATPNGRGPISRDATAIALRIVSLPRLLRP